MPRGMNQFSAEVSLLAGNRQSDEAGTSGLF